MQIARIALAAAATTALLATPAAQAKSKSLTCKSKAPTIAANQAVRVFATGKGALETRDLWACPRSGEAEPTFVFDGALNETWSSVRIAGDRYASVVDRYESQLDGLIDVSIYRADIKTRKTATWRTPLADAPADADVALLDDGSAAVIDRTDAASSLYLSRMNTKFSSDKITLDTGLGAQITQLATRNSRLYWLNNGTARSVAPGSTAIVAGPPATGTFGQFTTLPASAGKACDRARGATAIATPGARIFVRSRGKAKRSQRVYGCRRGGSKPALLLTSGSTAVFGGLAVAGRYVLTINAQRPSDPTAALKNTTLVVRDLVTHATTAARTDFVLGQIPDAVLTSSGTFAYLNAAIVTVGGPATLTSAPASASSADLAAGSATVFWVGPDGLPRAAY